jgi:SNF2-related domain
MSGITPNHSNVNNWNLNLQAPSLSAPCLPKPVYPEQDEDPHLDSLWANLTKTLPCPYTFLPEEDFNTPVLNAPSAPPTDVSATTANPNGNKTRKSKKNDQETQPRKKARLDTSTISPPSSIHLYRTPPSTFLECSSEIKDSLEYAPLTYPFFDRSSNAEDIEMPIFYYNPLLKPYQQREVRKLIHCNSKGVSQILALEAGLGKTYIYGEFIAQRITSNIKGIHLVIVPRSILHSVHEKLKIVLGLESVAAWRIHVDCCDNITSLNNTLNKLEDSNSVVVTTYEAAAESHVELAKHTFSTIIVDEVHRLTNLTQESRTRSEKTGILRRLESFIGAVRPNEPAVVLVTGAPLQDSFHEILLLLNFANPKGFESDKLVQIHNLVVEKIFFSSQNPIWSQNDAPLLAYIIRAFAHFEAFRQQIARPLIEFVRKEDPTMINDWQKRVPKTTDVMLNARITEKTRDLLNQTIGKNQKSHHAVRRILLHPDFAVDKIEKFNIPDIKELISKKLFIDQQWIDNSPLLGTLLNSKSLIRILKNKQNALIITEYATIAKILKKALQCKFAVQAPDVKVFHRNLSLEKKQQHIHWFKSPSALSSKILILMRNVDSLGLNLSETRNIFMTSMGWNPVKDEQAIARVLPFGSLGQHQITRINYDVYPQHHSHVVKAKTRAWKKFFWNDQQELYEQFKNWLDVLRQSCLQRKLNDCTCLPFAIIIDTMHPIEKVLSNILENTSEQLLQQSTSDELLQQAFDAVSSKRSASISLEKVHPIIPFRIRTFRQVHPFPSSSPASASALIPFQVRSFRQARPFSPAPVQARRSEFNTLPGSSTFQVNKN